MAKRAPQSACNPPFPGSPKAAHAFRSEELDPNDTLASLRNSSWRCQQMSASDNKTQSRASQQSGNLGLPASNLRCDLGASEPSHHPWHRHPEQEFCSHLPAAFCWRDPLLKWSWTEGNCGDAEATWGKGYWPRTRQHQATRAGGREQGWYFPINKWNVPKAPVLGRPCWHLLFCHIQTASMSLDLPTSHC